MEIEEEVMGGGRRTSLENLRWATPSIGGERGGSIDTVSPSWKLYGNPFYHYYHDRRGGRHHHHRSPTSPRRDLHNHIHLLPLSALELTASLWNLTTQYFQPMDPDVTTTTTSELLLARVRIKELKAELEFERRLRKKAESLNKALARELSEERMRGERACEGHAEEMDRLKREVEEERQMLRVSEVLREERVQMKLAEARLLMEEKLLMMISSSESKSDFPDQKAGLEAEHGYDASRRTTTTLPTMLTSSYSCGGDPGYSNDSRRSSSSSSHSHNAGSMGRQSPRKKEVENPHIKRGIKGFVEFPKVVRARTNSSSSSSCWREEGKVRGDPAGPKLECQMAQLRVLLKHRIPVGLGSSGTENLVL